jgi:hypothetical protein
VSGRLIYINGRFVPQLSKTIGTTTWRVWRKLTLDATGGDTQVRDCLEPIDGWIYGHLAVPVALGGGPFVRSSNLSGPDHNTGDPSNSSAINTQQGTACFAALNTVHTGAVAYIHSCMKRGNPNGRRLLLSCRHDCQCRDTVQVRI